MQIESIEYERPVAADEIPHRRADARLHHILQHHGAGCTVMRSFYCPRAAREYLANAAATGGMYSIQVAALGDER